MRKTLFLAILLVLGMSGMVWAATIEATTSDGKKVILKPDGTWSYAEESKAAPAGDRFEKPASATEVLKSQKGFCEVWYDPKKWKSVKVTNPAAEFELIHHSRDANALVIVERISMPLSALKNVALTNARNVAPDVAVEWEQDRTVNGTKVLAVTLAGTTQRLGIKFKYFGYYWSGQAGILQLVTYTGANLFDEFQADCTDLLNGMVITKK